MIRESKGSREPKRKRWANAGGVAGGKSTATQDQIPCLPAGRPVGLPIDNTTHVPDLHRAYQESAASPRPSWLWYLAVNGATWLPLISYLLYYQLVYTSYDLTQIFSYWMTWLILLYLVVAPVVIFAVLFFPLRHFRPRAALVTTQVIALLGLLGNIVAGAVLAAPKIRDVLLATNYYDMYENHGAPEFAYIALGILMAVLSLILLFRERQNTRTVRKLLVTFFASLAIFSSLIFAWGRYIHHRRVSMYQTYVNQLHQEDLALPIQTICGNGKCELNCRNSTRQAGNCKYEDPGTCSVDCQNICTWVKNAHNFDWQNAQGASLCQIGIANVGSLTSLQDLYYIPDYTACTTQSDCRGQETCAKVDLASGTGDKPSDTKVCVVNPVKQ